MCVAHENSTNRTLLRKWWKQRKLQSIVYDYVHHLGCLKSAPPWISLMAPKSSSYPCFLPVHWAPWAPWALLEGSHPPIPRPPITRDCPHFSLTAPPCPEQGSEASKRQSFTLACAQSRTTISTVENVLLGATGTVDPVENVHLLKGCNTKWYQGLHGYRKVLPEVPVVTTLVLSLGGPTTVLPIHRFPAIWSPSQFWNKEYPDQDLHCLTREGVNFLVRFALGVPDT